MATVEDIRWGSYRQYEGPFYRGKHPFGLPLVLSEEDKILAVVTATEGGRFDAINMYDGPPILSSGLIQFIEGKGQRSVTQMIGDTLKGSDVGDEFTDFLNKMGCTLAGSSGKWYLYDDEGSNKVDTTEEQNMLFRRGSNGEKGTWTEEATFTAKRWAAAVATLWEDPRAQFAQTRYTIPRLRQFCFGRSKRVVQDAFNEGSSISMAFAAAYISFAVNNPTRANRHLCIEIERRYPGGCWNWNEDFLIEMLKELTFGPKIAIYPHRYDAIRPVLEKLYGVDLPDFAKELDSWKGETDMLDLTTEELQKALISLGYDLGPYGADGQYGRKTREAMLSFEQTAGVPPEHCDGMVDVTTYSYLEEALHDRGVQTLVGLQAGS
jgi:hypothetical protein